MWPAPLLWAASSWEVGEHLEAMIPACVQILPNEGNCFFHREAITLLLHFFFFNKMPMGQNKTEFPLSLRQTSFLLIS